MSNLDYAAVREVIELLRDQVGRAQFAVLLRACVLWGALGATAGLALGFGAYRLFRRVRWYAAVSPAGRWAQRGIFVLTTLLSVMLLGFAGTWEGVRRASPHVVAESQLGLNLLPLFGEYAAEYLARADLLLWDDEPPVGPDARIEDFRAGRWELDAAAFLQRLATARDGGFEKATAELEETLLSHFPSLRGTAGEEILRQSVARVAPALLGSRLSSELRRHGLARLYDAIHTGLVGEAARSGNPATISYRELSAFIVREGLTPAIVGSTQTFARQQEFVCTLVALVVCFLPAAICRLCRPKTPPPPGGPGVTPATRAGT